MARRAPTALVAVRQHGIGYTGALPSMARRTRFPVVPPIAPTRGNVLSRAFGRLVVSALGWRIDGNLPNAPKCVMIAAPHTSTLDIIVGVACKVALGLEISWLGKHTVHKPPLSWLLRYVGAIAVDRTASHGVVGELVREFHERPAMYLGLAPEGTRRRVTQWKTGFYYVALRASVPIVTVALDYRARALRLGPPFTPTGDYATDLLVLRRRFTPEMAFRPERYADPEAPIGAAMPGPPGVRDHASVGPAPHPEGAE